MTPRSPFVVGLVRVHARRREPQHVEGADQVDLDDLAERLEVVRRAVSVDRAFGPTDARAVDARAQRRDLGRGGDRRGDLGLVGDIGLGERAVQLLGDDLALGHVAVDDHDVGALGGEPPSRGFAHPGGAAGDEGSGAFE